MDFEFSAFQEEMRDTVRRYLSEQAPLAYVRSVLPLPSTPKDTAWKGLSSLGATGLLVPEGQGGSGLTMVDMGVVLEEAGRALYPGPLLSSAVGTVTLLAELGATDLMDGLASGDVVGTVALLEPGNRYRWHQPTTVATSAGVLTGQKVAVADAAAADVLLVVASAPGRPPGAGGDVAVYAVDRDARGLDVVPTPTVDGTRKTATVTLSETPGRRLGAGDATPAVAATVDRLIIGAVVDGVGAAGRALEMAVEYAKVREQFGRPIGSFQAVQHLCADMLQHIELSRAGAYYALWAATSADPAERHRAATLAKAYASEWLPKVGASTIQVFGGIGFTWEHDAHLYYKRLLTIQQSLGGAAHHLEELACVILD